METLRYQPLGPDEIRVLDLGPFESDSKPIECQIRHLTLASSDTDRTEPPLYATLSYVWGPTHEDGPHLTEQLTCNGHRILITASLHSALHQISSLALLEDERGVEKPLPIWADAVCINQQDTTERNAQVRRMADIYRLSGVTIIWLGEPDDHDLHESQCSAIDKLKRMDEGEDCRLTRRESADLNLLTFRPWSSRRWILQEYLCSRDGQGEAWFLFGKHFCRASLFFHKLEELGLNPTINKAGSLLWSSKRETLLRLLHQSTQVCSDPRDRIYALHNVSADSDWLEVDYGQSFQELYMKVARHYSLTEELSNLLYCAATQAWNSNSTFKERDGSLVARCLPSWVPDWRVPTDSLNFFASGHVVATCTEIHNETLAIRGMISWPCVGAVHPASEDCLSCWLRERRGQTCCKACANAIIGLDHSRGHAFLLLPSGFQHGALVLSQVDIGEVRRTQTFKLERGYVYIKRCDEHALWSDAFEEPLPTTEISLI